VRKKTSICHYGAGVLAALLPIQWAVLICVLFGALEVWDAVNGKPSWWDYQEFVCGFVVTNALIVVLAIATGTPIKEAR